MIKFTTGNLLDSNAQALVNTVNTVGVMGKGIALMFKERFPENFKAYEAATREGKVQVGSMFVTERKDMFGPKWIINFPTKKHWRHPSKIEWIERGLDDLVSVIKRLSIRSVALPPLGAGNGGLEWSIVRELIADKMGGLDLDIVVFEPTSKYQNVAKRDGVQKLTPARAIIAELVRRYWVLGIECTFLEVQKLAWFAERVIETEGTQNPLKLDFVAHVYGPYASRLNHLLNSMDGSYLHCDKRIADAGPFDLIWFDDKKADSVQTYLRSAEGMEFRPIVSRVSDIIDGFESPLGMELLATVDWLIARQNTDPETLAVLRAVSDWPGGKQAAARKADLFDKRLIALAVDRLTDAKLDA